MTAAGLTSYRRVSHQVSGRTSSYLAPRMSMYMWHLDRHLTEAWIIVLVEETQCGSALTVWDYGPASPLGT